jgi:hypothetical protein
VARCRRNGASGAQTCGAAFPPETRVMPWQRDGHF